MYHFNDFVWSVINRDNFCCFKNITDIYSYCRNDFNISGICSKKSCPLVNNRYATVIEKNGIIYLYIKQIYNPRLAGNNLWKKIILSRNYLKSIQQIEKNLPFWSKFFISKIKQKLTKIVQIQTRQKLFNLLYKTKWLTITRKKETNFKNINLEKFIEHELCHRLHTGLYGKLYKLPHILKWKITSINSSLSSIKQFSHNINNQSIIYLQNIQKML